jgi:Zn-finger nucleic acid-binding protein
MSLFHMVLTLRCPSCGIHLVRVAPSEYLDLAVCPKCLASGPYDAIVEEGAELMQGQSLPADVADYVRGLHA